MNARGWQRDSTERLNLVEPFHSFAFVVAGGFVRTPTLFQVFLLLRVLMISSVVVIIATIIMALILVVVSLLTSIQTFKLTVDSCAMTLYILLQKFQLFIFL